MASAKAAPQLLELQPATQPAHDKDAGIVRRRAAKDLSYSEFFWQYMHANWPVILTNVSNDWECRQNWTTAKAHNVAAHNANAKDNNANTSTITAPINFDYLKSRIGDCLVPVADCNASYFNSHAKLELKFYDFLERWKSSIASAKQTEINSNVSDNLYLKDWHLAAQLPAYDFYCVPKHFASDWLNEQLISLQRDDYRFVYMGPKQSWTSFHADVFGSYSWSTNIVGHKKWLIMPPGEELKLADQLGNMPFSIDEAQLKAHSVHYYTINQTANEAVFVPSGWFHQVWNETDTISVNHNWFNACNIKLVWLNLQANMKAVRKEIEDCRQMDNFESHCQTMLRASFGINYLDFIELLEFIAQRRLSDTSILLFNSFKMNDYHINYDLACIAKLLLSMLQDETVRQSTDELYARCVRLLQQLKSSTGLDI